MKVKTTHKEGEERTVRYFETTCSGFNLSAHRYALVLQKAAKTWHSTGYDCDCLLQARDAIQNDGKMRHFTGGRVACWVCCPALCSVEGSALLWAFGRGDFSLGGNVGPDSIPKNSFRWEFKPTFCLCAHAFLRTDSKDPDVHVLNNKNTPSMHHSQRWNVTTSMVGLKKRRRGGGGVVIRTILNKFNKNGESQRYRWERRRRRLGKTASTQDLRWTQGLFHAQSPEEIR